MKEDIRSTFNALNGVRGVAALSVALFHAHPLFGDQFVPSGYLAVDLFFVMSGCVIAHAYEHKLAHGLSFRGFMVRRLVRFMPFYLAGLGIGAALAVILIVIGSPSALTGSELGLLILFGLFFIPAHLTASGNIFPLNVPAWSLFYELVVNALYAATVRVLSDRVLIAVLGIALIVTTIGIYLKGNATFGPLFNEAPYALARTIFSFTAGVLIYRHRRVFQIKPLPVVIVIGLLFFVPVVDAVRWVFDLVAIAVVFPIATALLISSNEDKPNRIYAVLGDMSYGLYAMHYPLIWLARGVSERLELNAAAIGVLLIVALVFLCTILERQIDRPLRAILLRYLEPATAGRLFGQRGKPA